MADSDDSTSLPGLPRPPSVAGHVCLPVGADGVGMRDLEALMAPMKAWPGVPDAESVAAMDAASARLHALEPQSLGDAVAKLMAVTVASGDCPPPETVSLITTSVAYLTRDAPELRRPALERFVLAYAQRMHGA